MADPELLRYLAAKSGLGIKYLSKDEKISILLGELRTRFPDVVMKGGTAINRAYLARSGVSRFSEDIDLDFISKRPLFEKISSISERMKTITAFEIDGPHILHLTLRFDCQYTNEFGDKDRIMAEFYLTKTRAVKTLDALVSSPFIETHPTIFTIYSLEDLLARKLLALYNRGEGKDMYDVFYLLKEKIDCAAFDKALAFMQENYRINSNSFSKDLIDKMHILKKNATYIGNSTNHFIPRQQRPDWRTFIDSLIEDLDRFFMNCQ
jgi:predicted nucleotidyltransferase component of viral defense system